MADRTKLWIAKQMKELMKKKTIDKIRVTEICKAAEIERSTFYYHFKDKYDLLAWIFFTSTKDVNLISVKEGATHIQQMKNDYLFFKNAYKDNSQNALWLYMLEYFVDGYTKIAKEKLKVDTLDPQLAFSIRLYCYGGVGMSREWILNDQVTPPETVISRMFASMPQSMRELFFPKSPVASKSPEGA